MAFKDTHYSSQQVDNREHDPIAGLGRVSLFPASSLRIIDTSSSTVTYIGVAAANTATSAIGAWLIERITVSGTTTTIDHATDAWDNHSTSAIYT